MNKPSEIPIHSVFGIDFSGAKLAGRNIWVARVDLTPSPTLVALDNLEKLAGTADRVPALAHLVSLISASDAALWAADFPFGLPLELFGRRTRWPGQFAYLRRFGDDAYACGLDCLRIARGLGGKQHIRRATDTETRAPFDCYHYRIIYQTFYGMRDVLGPLQRDPTTRILPFQYDRLPTAKRILVEACPSSTLKRLGLPHHTYKQPAGGPLLPKRRRNRRVILDALAARVTITSRQRRTMMRNGGGDALDAVLAAVGAMEDWRTCDHEAVAGHARYPREGRIYA